uniref:Uncharacterized protein n=1 Tax=Steinernema glaseri TaxID=37863 RepID=A0A1I7Z5P1_9BILA
MFQNHGSGGDDREDRADHVAVRGARQIPSLPLLRPAGLLDEAPEGEGRPLGGLRQADEPDAPCPPTVQPLRHDSGVPERVQRLPERP